MTHRPTKEQSADALHAIDELNRLEDGPRHLKTVRRLRSLATRLRAGNWTVIADEVDSECNTVRAAIKTAVNARSVRTFDDSQRIW